MPTYNAAKVELGAGYMVARVYPTGGWVQIGATLGGEFTYVPDMKNIECDQVMAPITTVMIGEESTFKITMMESTMRNLVMALGMNPDTDIYGTAASPEYTEFGDKHSPVFINAKYTVAQTNDTTKNFIVELWRCRVTSGLSLPFSKNEERRFEVTLTAYACDNAAVGTLNKLGSIKREF